MSEHGTRPVEWLRALALAAERLAARGVAGGAVRGAADELAAELPDDVQAQVRTLIQEGLVVVERLVEEAGRPDSSLLGTWSQTAATGAVRGAVEELRRLVPEMRPMNQQLLRAVTSWLERTSSESAVRAEEIRVPGSRARVKAAGAIAGAVEQLNAALPALAAPAAEFASLVGRGVMRGASEELGRQLRLVRAPRVRKAVTATAVVLVVLVLAATRRR
jgi:hypothetical protein